MSLREAYLHLQLGCKRSFFVYQFDVPFLSLVERKLAVRNAAMKQEASVRPSSPLSKWKSFGLHSKNTSAERFTDRLTSENAIGPARQTWIEHERFDGSLPSRILPHVYLGNMQVALENLLASGADHSLTQCSRYEQRDAKGIGHHARGISWRNLERRRCYHPRALRQCNVLVRTRRRCKRWFDGKSDRGVSITGMRNPYPADEYDCKSGLRSKT